MSILFPILLILLALIVEYFTVTRAFKGLKYGFEINKQAVECNEEFELETTIISAKRYPVLHLAISETVPASMQVDVGATGARVDLSEPLARLPRKRISQTLYLLPRQRIKRTVKATLPARGRYTVQSVRLTVGDLLGISAQQQEVTLFREVVVFPEKTVSPALNDAVGGYMGDVMVRRFIVSDPILTCGFREYTGREPMKDIAWPQSTRAGRLMVKQYDHTAEPRAAVLLNADCPDAPAAAVESAYSLARAVMEKLESMRVRYSFFTNADTASTAGRWAYIDEGLGERHLFTILEGLGRATLSPRFPLQTLIDTALRRCDRINAIVFVTPLMDGRIRAAVRRLESASERRVLIVESGKEALS